PVRQTIPFVSPGVIPDPATWAGELMDLVEGTEVRIGMEISIFDRCPIYCGNYRDFIYEGLTDEEEIVVEEDPEIVLTDYECDDQFEPDSTHANTEPLTSLDVGEIITVNGFPILIDALQQNTSSAGKFTGTGIVPTPWNDQTLKVSFSGYVNKYRVFYDGTVEGVRDELTDYDFSLDTLVIGGEICVPPTNDEDYPEDEIDPVTGLDQWGFVDSTGLHSVTGQAWDEYGYDRDGNHVDTEGPFGPDGCSRENRDADGNYCEPTPYVDPAAQAFIDSLAQNLQPTAQAVLTQLTTAIADSLSLQQTACNNIRTVMDGLIGENILDFEQKAIYGDSNQYYNPGMSLRFAERPEPFGLNIDRDPNVESLERHHILLYGCDEKELEVIARQADLASVEITGLVDFLVQQLSYLTGEQVTALEDEAAFNAWIAEQIMLYIAQGGAADGNAAIPLNGRQRAQEYRNNAPAMFSVPAHQFNQFGTLAAQDFTTLGFNSMEEMLRYELNSQFQQGFQQINGVHRAHIL
ncbi:MAG: hypothetical protein AAF597_14155, partial [Bacteroidota bacterium]